MLFGVRVGRLGRVDARHRTDSGELAESLPFCVKGSGLPSISMDESVDHQVCNVP
jgi:hypothetical protein